MRPRTETPSVVFGHERVAAIMVCPVRIWSVSREAWRTGSPYLRRSARQRVCGFLWARCRRFASRPPTLVEDRLEAYSTKIRPTDFCHPTDTCLPVPALVALVLSLARWGLAQPCATDRGTRRFTTSLPASAGSDDAVLGFSPRPFVRIELLTPLSPARGGAPPSQATASSRSSQDRRPPASVKRPGEWTIGGAFLR